MVNDGVSNGASGGVAADDPGWQVAGASRYLMEVINVHGRADVVEFKIRRECVEVWTREHCCGVLDRVVLRAWLAAPELSEALAVDEVICTMNESGRPSLDLPDIGLWPLAPHVLAGLRDRV
jgi:hypothetical protein